MVLNFHARPGYRVHAEGRELGPRSDTEGRIVITVPPGADGIRLVYDGGWARGGLIALLLGALGAVVLLAAGRREAAVRARGRGV